VLHDYSCSSGYHVIVLFSSFSMMRGSSHDGSYGCIPQEENLLHPIKGIILRLRNRWYELGNIFKK